MPEPIKKTIESTLLNAIPKGKKVILASWNTQWAKGYDGLVSTERIANQLRLNGDVDIIFLQEVNVGNTGLRGIKNENQVEEYQKLFDEYFSFYTPSVLKTNENHICSFGNLILTRKKFFEAFNIFLPNSSKTASHLLPRTAQVIRINYKNEPLTLINTHLEYYDPNLRQKQLKCILDFCKHPPPKAIKDQYLDIDSVFLENNAFPNFIIGGDFNMTKNAVTQKTKGLHVNWNLMGISDKNSHTVGLHPEFVWPKHADCVDHFILADPLKSRVRRTWVDQKTKASDHQPIFMEIF